MTRKTSLVPSKPGADIQDIIARIPTKTRADPRKVLFLANYFDRESPTWGNAKQSAIRAGFSVEYAECITYQRPDWFSEFLGSHDLGDLAERHITETLMIPNISQAMGAFGPVFKTEIVMVKKKYKNGKTRMIQKKVKVPVMVPNTSVIKVKNEASKLVLPAYKPDKYSNRGPKISFNFNVKSARNKYQ